MSKSRKSQAATRHRVTRQSMLWFVGATLLAVITGIIILWIVRQPASPSMSVISPASYSNGDESYQPGTSRKYVIVEVEVKNPTAQVFHFAPVVQTYLSDDKGNQYDMAPSELANPIAAGSIMPGETKRGQLSYNVPIDVSGLSFHFVTDDIYDISFMQSL
ncbi:MAG: DUF4352 domain-containing protein [Candidatus Saccharimonas sp.]